MSVNPPFSAFSLQFSAFSLQFSAFSLQFSAFRLASFGKKRLSICLLLFSVLWVAHRPGAAEPQAPPIVVLTFDDSAKSHATVVAPLLKRLGFGATFFITEGFDMPTNKTSYMTWEEIAGLHRMGFEIGNHTAKHENAARQTREAFAADLELIEHRCREHGIPRPRSFAYPGNSTGGITLDVLKQHGYRFARRGGSPEFRYEEGRGVAYDPKRHDRLMIPSAGDARPAWKLEAFLLAIDQAEEGKAVVLQFHGVPDREHPWVNTNPELFAQMMEVLKSRGCRVIALRDLDRTMSERRWAEGPLISWPDSP